MAGIVDDRAQRAPLHRIDADHPDFGVAKAFRVATHHDPAIRLRQIPVDANVGPACFGGNANGLQTGQGGHRGAGYPVGKHLRIGRHAVFPLPAIRLHNHRPRMRVTAEWQDVLNGNPGRLAHGLPHGGGLGVREKTKVKVDQCGRHIAVSQDDHRGGDVHI